MSTCALVADDSMLSRMVLSKHLKLLYPGIEIVQADTGVIALEKYNNWVDPSPETHVIFLDFMMPEMTGLEVLEEIRKGDKLVPIYIITANVQDKTRDEAKRLGATAFINKTMKIGELRTLLGIEAC